MMDGVEHYLSRAEIAYRESDVEQAVIDAEKAVELCGDSERMIALRIFIARCYSKLGKIEKSNEIYRSLINEDVYLPPIIMGLMHNNLVEGKSEKLERNVQIVKIFLGGA